MWNDSTDGRTVGTNPASFSGGAIPDGRPGRRPIPTRGVLEAVLWKSLFSQEYPLTPSESFISSTFDSFIPAELVIRARREKVECYGPLVIGVDPAGMGADRTSIAWRRGHVIVKVESRRGLDTMETTGWINRIIDEEKPDRVNLDVGGMGVGIYDRLIEMGHRRNVVQPVNFGGKPVEPAPLDETGRPAGGSFNRRSEMWSNVKKALEAGRFSLPDSDSLQADLVSVGYKYTSDGKLLQMKPMAWRCASPTPVASPAARISTAISQTATKIYTYDETTICVYPNPQTRRCRSRPGCRGGFYRRGWRCHSH